KNKRKKNKRNNITVKKNDKKIKKNHKREKTVKKGIRTSERTENDITISYVEISDEGADTIQKKAGTYITIYADGVKKQDTKSQENAAKILADEMEKLIQKHHIPRDAVCLVVDFGN